VVPVALWRSVICRLERVGALVFVFLVFSVCGNCLLLSQIPWSADRYRMEAK
jgi:hypothetical protein